MADPIDPKFDRMMADGNAIGALCHLVRSAGLTMTLHGVPVDEDGLRAAAEESAKTRIIVAILAADAAARGGS